MQQFNYADDDDYFEVGDMVRFHTGETGIVRDVKYVVEYTDNRRCRQETMCGGASLTLIESDEIN